MVPLRCPNRSTAAPTWASGSSTTASSKGSFRWPSTCLVMTCPPQCTPAFRCQASKTCQASLCAWRYRKLAASQPDGILHWPTFKEFGQPWQVPGRVLCTRLSLLLISAVIVLRCGPANVRWLQDWPSDAVEPRILTSALCMLTKKETCMVHDATPSTWLLRASSVLSKRTTATSRQLTAVQQRLASHMISDT